MINVSLLPNASDVVNTPGALTYQTSTSIADTAAFYQKQLPSLGWKLQGQADISAADGKALMDFTKDNLDMSVFITSNAGVITVNIMLTRTQK